LEPPVISAVLPASFRSITSSQGYRGATMTAARKMGNLSSRRGVDQAVTKDITWSRTSAGMRACQSLPDCTAAAKAISA